MKLALLSLCMAVALAPSACRRPRDTGLPKAVPVATDGVLRLRVLTFNVRYENPGDWGPRAWPSRVPGAVRMIRSEAPDVFGVQEALHGQAADLWASLPDYEFLGVGRDDGGRRGEYAGIFFRRDRFETDPSDCGTFWLSDRPETPGSMTWGNSIPRTAMWSRLIDRSTQRGFYVFNTHWDHRHQGSREKAAELIRERIAHRRKLDEPVVLLGDFNAVESNTAIRTLLAPGPDGRPFLLDTFQLLHAAEARRTTLHFWQNTRAGRLKVDHVFVSPDAMVEAAAIRDGDKPMVSDHFPVTARIAFPAAAVGR